MIYERIKGLINNRNKSIKKGECEGGINMALKNSSLVDKWLEDEKLELLESWARDYTKSEIAERIGISPGTLTKWTQTYPEIAQAIEKGAEIIDYKVENALLKSALGFTTKEIKVTVGKQKKTGGTFEITKETTIREIAPNVTACLAWLNNRRPDKWRRNRDKEISINDEDTNLSITIIRGPQEGENSDNINKEIKIGPKEKKKEESKKSSSKIDKDYWPEDWEDEDE